MAPIDRRHPTPRRLVALAAGLAILAVVVVASLAIGSRQVPPSVVLDALLGREAPAADWRAVIELRVPRTAVGALVGASLGVAGALIQAVTRNPLADPGILGVTAGASFFVAMAVVLLGVTSPAGYVWFALVGALAATITVSLVGGSRKSNIDPVRLTLAGVALSAVLSGIVSGLRIASPRTFNAIQVWEAGSLVERGWSIVLPVLPFLVAGFAAALLLGGSLNALALGEEVATTLGTSVWRTRIIAVLAVALLAGGATAIAGPIAFIGLMVPHLARRFAGPDQRWIILLTIVWAPVILISADIASRVVIWPGEMPVGIVTAFIGAPVLIAIVRRRKVLAL